MKVDDRTTLYVDFEHLLDFDDVLAKAIVEDYYRYNAVLG